MQLFVTLGIILGLLFYFTIHHKLDLQKVSPKGSLALAAFCCVLGIVAVFVLIRYLFYFYRYLVVGLMIALILWLLFHKKAKRKGVD